VLLWSSCPDLELRLGQPHQAGQREPVLGSDGWEQEPGQPGPDVGGESSRDISASRPALIGFLVFCYQWKPSVDQLSCALREEAVKHDGGRVDGEGKK